MCDLRKYFSNGFIAINNRNLSNLLLISFLFLSFGSFSQDNDTTGLQPMDMQSWNVGRFTYKFNPKWSIAVQAEARISDNISRLDEAIFKLYSHVNFSDKVGLSFGFKYIDRPDSYNDFDPWQEVVFPRKYGLFLASHQIRLEERIIQTVPGVLPRIRYLLNFSHPIGNSIAYYTGFGAVRFNIGEKGVGPVAGFEQFRIYIGIGFHLGGVTRLEIGYLYRYEVSRDAQNLNDSVIHLNLFFNNKKREVKQPLPNDHFQ
ncbi:MAG: hypothetical protein DRI54_04675 [Bacteroidetes bacterium]|nr:MAG: hypothetical protein DRI54_04675 [Bacteroidota bacterium]